VDRVVKEEWAFPAPGQAAVHLWNAEVPGYPGSLGGWMGQGCCCDHVVPGRGPSLLGLTLLSPKLLLFSHRHQEIVLSSGKYVT
jgi:hypothetical protein